MFVWKARGRTARVSEGSLLDLRQANGSWFVLEVYGRFPSECGTFGGLFGDTGALVRRCRLSNEHEDQYGRPNEGFITAWLNSSSSICCEIMNSFVHPTSSHF